MNRCTRSVALLAAGAFLLLAGAAEARVPMTRTEGQKSSGSRQDITVPYLTNGTSAFGMYNGVAPQVVKGPIVDDDRYPGDKPVFNLPFYGSVKAFSGTSVGAVPSMRLQGRP
jgi:hypothetical protein